MARKPRIHFPGAVYHVILRGNAEQDIFSDDEERYRFYLLIQEGLECYGHRVLLSNHLMLQGGKMPLAHFMQNVTFR